MMMRLKVKHDVKKLSIMQASLQLTPHRGLVDHHSRKSFFHILISRFARNNYGTGDSILPEMEEQPDAADASVLCFSLAVLIFLGCKRAN